MAGRDNENGYKLNDSLALAVNRRVPGPGSYTNFQAMPYPAPSTRSEDSLASVTGANTSIDEGVINRFDIQTLRMAVLVLAEDFPDMSIVTFHPAKNSNAREREKFMFIDPSLYSATNFKKFIKKQIETTHYQQDGLNKFYEVVKEKSEKYLIDKNKVAWLKDKNAACWLWCYIKHASQFTIPFNGTTPTPIGMNLPDRVEFFPQRYIVSWIPAFYGHTGIPEPEIKTPNLTDAVIAYFDHWLIDKETKHVEIDNLHRYWVALNNSKIEINPFAFLETGDSEGITWCWNYVANKIPVIQWNQFYTVSDSEKRMLLTSLYLVWNCSPDTRKLFVYELRRAWSQRKFRAEQKTRKLFQAYIDPRQKEMLTILAKEKGMKINELLERIIDDAYKLMKK